MGCRSIDSTFLADSGHGIQNLKHMSRRRCTSPTAGSGQIHDCGYGLGYTIDEGGSNESHHVTPRCLIHFLQQAQMEDLVRALREKTIHRVFYSQCLQEGWDTKGYHTWLGDSRLRSQNEVLVLAA